MSSDTRTHTSEEKPVPRWTDKSDRLWPVEVVPAWAYDRLKKENDDLRMQLEAELKWRRENSND